MTSQGVVYVDEDDGSYRLKLPRNWSIHREPKWLSLQGSMQWCFETFPDAAQYGWLADDTRPRTQGWDKKLEAAAGDWILVCCRDLWFSEDPWERAKLENAQNLSSGLCWGGGLVRAAGWWALPGVRQAGIDTAWLDIVKPVGLHNYIHDVTVEHLNWRTGKRPKDAMDSWDREGVDYIDQDFAEKNRWLQTFGYRDTLRRIARTVALADPQLAAARKAIRVSEVDERWAASGRSLPAARVQRMLDAWEGVTFESEHPDADQGPPAVDT